MVENAMLNLSDSFFDMSAQQVSAIMELLAKQSGHPPIDAYKESCVKRRIAARIQRSGCRDADDYLELLSHDPGECVLLTTSLLIHVSQFFRNPTMFEALRRRLLPFFADRPSNHSVRCWSMGCSAGEEPYSLAMLLLESYPEAVQTKQVEVLATDFDGRTLALAEAGLYDEEALREVSAERRSRFFLHQANSFKICAAVQKLVTFRQMDMQQTELYPLADLILCRNSLIYFNRPAQEKILHALADILSEDGILVLGKSETMPSPLRRRFATLDPVERIYCRIE